MIFPRPRPISRFRALAAASGLALVGALGPATPASAAVIEVTTEVDVVDPFDGACSLREAILASDENLSPPGEGGECLPGDPGHDTIELAGNGVYLLRIGDFFLEDDPPALTGDLDIYDAGGMLLAPGRVAVQPSNHVLTIEGNGSVIDAGGLEHSPEVPAPDRVFHVQGGFGVVINDLTIQGGGGPFDITGDNAGPTPVDQGGGILVEPGGAAELHASTVRQNQADDGGGIYNNEGHVELLDGSVVGGPGPDDANFAPGEGGGLFTVGAQPPGTLIVDGSSVQGNVALEDGGGIYNGGEIINGELEGDRVEIRNGSDVSDNIAGAICQTLEPEFDGGDGGGIWTNARADFQGGQIVPGSPGLFIDDSTVQGNQALFCPGGELEGSGLGGGIFNVEGGHVEITGGSVIGPDNEAEQDGGGIWTSGGPGSFTLSIDGSTITGNSAAQHGGGIYSFFDSVDITNSTVSENTAEFGDGGGIWFEGEDFGEGVIALSLLNSTISGNSALEPAIDASGLGGGIYGHGGPIFLDSVTLEDNLADVAGGNIALGINQASTTPTANLHNTIISNGVPQNCASDDGMFVSNGFNLSTEDGAMDECGLGPAGTDLLGSNALLGPLQNNGGQTATHALSQGSPAIDSGDGGEGCPPTDQRGVSRPKDGDGNLTADCDRGAFERDAGDVAAGAGGKLIPPVPECEIVGTAGADILLGTDLGEDLCGLAGDDTIRGGGGNDNLFGDEGDDVLDGGPANDALVGGPGTDTGDYSGAPGSVDADLTRQTAVGVGASTDTLFDLENLTGSEFKDVLAGDDGPNGLRGLGGGDRLVGRGGSDTIRGNRGKDTGKGDAGNDLVKGGRGRDKLRGGGGRDVLTGGQKNDDLRGNAGNDELRGGGGDDDLNGNAGDDECNGGSGNDTLINCET